MIAVDTNILIYAHREDSQWHSGTGEPPLQRRQRRNGLHGVTQFQALELSTIKKEHYATKTIQSSGTHL